MEHHGTIMELQLCHMDAVRAVFPIQGIAGVLGQSDVDLGLPEYEALLRNTIQAQTIAYVWQVLGQMF